MSSHAVTETDSGTFRVFEGEPHYIEGYVPSSLDSQHSALNQGTTWMGMGIILSSVIGIGTMVFGLGSRSVGSQEHWMFFTILGIVITLACWVIGWSLIHYGRRNYRAYIKRTGRIH